MNDTICALATAPGGALGIIRISGAQSFEILSRVFSKDISNAQPNTIHYGHIKNGSEILDECMVSIFGLPTLTLVRTLWRLVVMAAAIY